MTTVLVGQPVGADEVVADYLDHVATLGLSGRAVRDRIRIARDFTARHRDLHAWMTLPAAERIAEIRDTGAWPLICHTIGTGRLRLDVELAAVKQLTGLGRAVEDRIRADSPRCGMREFGWAGGVPGSRRSSANVWR
ncbi:phage integrase family domain protein [Mycobacterium avium MAV_120809_2495]|uniref:hypothetical protein n=1 Tax=Mycobacterium avium TaxID=1764 RepID=UPI00044E406E|nr:hypothetical protein [Mycobacterium avium]ETZ40723.1 phage integrase family domain protein [Mycobacterium avium MAV_120809_2495]